MVQVQATPTQHKYVVPSLGDSLWTQLRSTPVLFLELHLILLLVFIWIHWGMARSRFCCLARNHSILKVLWEDMARKSQPHALRWRQKREFTFICVKNWKICGISRLVMLSENIWNMNIMARNQPWFPKLIMYIIQGEERFETACVFVVHCYLVMFYFWEFSERQN